MSQKKQRILVVDDDIGTVLKFPWEEALDACEFEYAFALDGMEGLRKLLEVTDNPFDALVTDLRMPGSIDGIELIRQIGRRKIQLKAVHLYTSYRRNNKGPLTDEVCAKVEAQGATIWFKDLDVIERIAKRLKEQLQA